MTTFKLIALSLFVAIFTLGASSAFAAHITVGGSNNGSFQISGNITMYVQHGCTVYGEVFFSDDSGPPSQPILMGSCDLYDPGTSPWVTCEAHMSGVVTNGVAQINSVVLYGGTEGYGWSMCPRTTLSGLPWKIEPMSPPGLGNAEITTIKFMAPATFNCSNVKSPLDLGGGYVEFGSLVGQGCNFITEYDASTVTPALEVVYP